MALSTRYRPMTPADVAALSGCVACGAAPVDGDAAWLRAAMDELGCCGVGAYENGHLIGHLVLASARHLPPDFQLAVGARDAAAVVRVRVDDEYTRAGVAKGLLQAAAGRLPVRQLDALSGTVPTCAQPPSEWLEAAGFRPVRRVGAATLWRLDLRGAARWRELSASAWDRISGLLPRPAVAPPNPANRAA